MLRKLTLLTLAAGPAAAAHLRLDSRRAASAASARFDGDGDVYDTCAPLSFKDDCCKNVNCLWTSADTDKKTEAGASLCEKREDAADNGVCDAARGPPTQTAAGEDAAMAQAGSAGNKIANAGNKDGVQVKTAGQRTPPLPAEPACEGTGSPCNFPDSGRQGLGMWGADRPASKGGVIKSFVNTGAELEELGVALRTKYLELKGAHDVNQRAMADALQLAADQATASYAKRNVAQVQFAQYLNEYDYNRHVAEDAVLTLEGDVSKVLASTTEDMAATKTWAEGKKADGEDFLKQYDAFIAAMKADIDGAGFAEASDDTDMCKAEKAKVKAFWTVQMEAAAANKVQTTAYLEQMTKDLASLAKKTAKVTAADAKLKEGIATVKTNTDKYSKAVDAAVAAITEAETAMLTKFDADSAGATPGVALTGNQAAVAGAAAAQNVDVGDLGQDAEDKAAANANGAVAVTKGAITDEGASLNLVELQAKIKAYKSLDGLGHMLRDAVRHRMAHGAPPPAAEAGAAAGGETASSVKIPGALDNSEFQNAPKSVRALAAEVDSIDIKKGGDFNFNAANLDTSKFSVAMTHVDAMVTKMKLALDCLKQYLAYYQTGASQIQSIYKTEHESIVAVIKEKTTDLMAANVQMHENYQELLNQLTILKSVLGSCSLLNTAMKASTDLNQDGFASLQQQWEITQQTKVDPAKCAKHEPIKPAAKLKRKPRKPRKPVNDQNAEALTQIAATISDVDVDVTGVRTESTPTGF